MSSFPVCPGCGVPHRVKKKDLHRIIKCDACGRHLAVRLHLRFAGLKPYLEVVEDSENKG